MKEYSDQEIENIYSNLPEDLKSAIFSIETDEEIVKIGKKYNLNIEKVGNLGNETGMVMLGVTRTNDFVFNLAKLLEIDKVKAKEIADDVNEQIFKKVRDSLRKIHDEREEGGDVLLAQSSGQTIEEKNDILKEIEKEDVLVAEKEEEKIPDIFKGTMAEDDIEVIKKEEVLPVIPIKKEINPFEAKLKDEVYKAPKEETVEDSSESAIPDKSKGYAADPYRESLE